MVDRHPVDVEIGAAIRAARETAGMSQGALARTLDWHRPTLTIVESGEQGLRARDLSRLALALGVPVAALLPAAWTVQP